MTNDASLGEKEIRSKASLILDKLYKDILIGNVSIHDFMNNHYQNKEYLAKSDYFVPLSSQLLDRENSASDLNFATNLPKNSSIIQGFEEDHTYVHDDPYIGTRIMFLLNAPISSDFFADKIAANTNSIFKAESPKQEALTSFADSIKTHFDKAHIEIISPLTKSIAYIDSTIQVKINLKDTTHLTGIRLFFQGEFYDSYSKIANQTFDFKVHSNAIGKNIVFAEATYDSLGFTINHVDTISLNVKSKTALKGFYASPKTVYLNPQQTFTPTYNAVYDTFVGQLNNDIDSLSFAIADTNVIRYDKTTAQFIAKDSSSTHITFTYKGFSDTVFIILTIPEDNVCPANANVTSNYVNGETQSFYASTISANNQIRNASKITYQAENAIFLNPGFYVDNTSNVFKAQIGGCASN